MTDVNFKRSYHLSGWRAEVAIALTLLLAAAVLVGFAALVLWGFHLQIVRA